MKVTQFIMILTIIPIFGIGVGYAFINKFKKFFFFLLTPWIVAYTLAISEIENSFVSLLFIVFLLILWLYSIADISNYLSLDNIEEEKKDQCI